MVVSLVNNPRVIKLMAVRKHRGCYIYYAIDGMHLKKNVFESVIGILMEILGKTKDDLKSRRDMVQLNVKLAFGISRQLVTRREAGDVQFHALGF